MVTIPQHRDFLMNTITNKFSKVFFNQVSQIQPADDYHSYVIFLAFREGKHDYGGLLALCIKLGRSE